MSESKIKYTDYIKVEKLPHFYCPGCGAGVVFSALTRVLAELEYDPHKTVFVCGIGCWGNIDRYVKANAIHGTHGRTLGFATGIKLANPELNVIAIVGDGDGITIGGNHFIQAARRNIDVTCIMLNNQNYGMTGGQVSATTPHDGITSTTKYGNPERGFDISKVAAACGANYSARGTVYHAPQLQKLLKDGLKKKGFSFIEVMSPCVTGFDRYNKRGSVPEMYAYLRDHAKPYIPGKSTEADLGDGDFFIGVMADADHKDLITAYEEKRAIALSKLK